ncbi:hypothetical protein THAOC_21922, partial [Thalassiosira oceanica]
QEGGTRLSVAGKPLAVVPTIASMASMRCPSQFIPELNLLTVIRGWPAGLYDRPGTALACASHGDGIVRAKDDWYSRTGTYVPIYLPLY